MAIESPEELRTTENNQEQKETSPDKLESTLQDLKIMTESPENKKKIALGLGDVFGEIMKLSKGEVISIDNPSFSEQNMIIKLQNGPDSLKGIKPQTIEIIISEPGKDGKTHDRKVLVIFRGPDGKVEFPGPLSMREETVEYIDEKNIANRFEHGATKNFKGVGEAKSSNNPKIGDISDMLSSFKGALKNKRFELVEGSAKEGLDLAA